MCVNSTPYLDKNSPDASSGAKKATHRGRYLGRSGDSVGLQNGIAGHVITNGDIAKKQAKNKHKYLLLRNDPAQWAKYLENRRESHRRAGRNYRNKQMSNQESRTKMNQYQASWQKENKKKVQQYKRAWYKKLKSDPLRWLKFLETIRQRRANDPAYKERVRASTWKSEIQIRLKALRQYDMRCSRCNWDEHPQLLQFDHIVPAWKTNKTPRRYNRAARVRAALQDPLGFQLLCPICHNLKTTQDLKEMLVFRGQKPKFLSDYHQGLLYEARDEFRLRRKNDLTATPTTR